MKNAENSKLSFQKINKLQLKYHEHSWTTKFKPGRRRDLSSLDISEAHSKNISAKHLIMSSPVFPDRLMACLKVNLCKATFFDLFGAFS